MLVSGIIRTDVVDVLQDLILESDGLGLPSLLVGSCDEDLQCNMVVVIGIFYQPDCTLEAPAKLTYDSVAIVECVAKLHGVI